MAEEFISPEEKLLRLIRGERKAKEKPAAEKVSASPAAQKPPEPPVARKYPAIAGKAGKGHDYIRVANTVMIAVIAVMSIVFVADLVNGRPREQAVNKTSVQMPVAQKEQQGVEKPEAEADDAANLASRDLFKASAAAIPPGDVPKASYDKIKNLSLKGIIAGDNPQAIIEDENSKKSYFMSKGESVNDIKVEDIQPDRVIIKVNGEVLELTL